MISRPLLHACGVVAVAALATAAPGSVTHGDATCPSSIVQLSKATGRYDDPRSAADTTYAGPSFTSTASFDLIDRTLGLSVTPADGDTIVLFAAEAYTLIGPPAGTDVNVNAVLEFQGSIGTSSCGAPPCDARFRAGVFDEFFIASKGVDAPASGGSTPAGDVVELPVAFTVGVPKTVWFFFRIGMAPGGLHEGAWTGQYHFDVPEGATLVPCRNAEAGPTEILPATWGKLKALYR